MIKQLSKISVFTILIILGLSLNIYSDEPLDSDNDGMPDSWEITYGLNPSLNDADNDADNDSLSNIKEFQYNTFPNDPDTDNDGLLDGEEILEIGEEFQINTNTVSDQSFPSIASDGINYFVTWVSLDGDQDVWGQIFDNEGNKLGSEFHVYNFSEQASIASDGTNYFVAGARWFQDGNYEGVYGQIFNDEGNQLDSEFQINTYTTDFQAYPSIACNGTNYFVAWMSSGQDGSGHGIYGRLFDNEGNELGSELQVNTYTSDDQNYPSIASNGANYFVTWTSWLQDGSYYGVYGQLFDNEGNKLGSELQINTYTPYYQDQPSIASDGTNYLVTWCCWGQDGDYHGVYGQIFDNEGHTLATEFQINTFTTSNLGGVSVASDGINYLIAWSSYAQDGNYSGIYGQFIDNEGHKLGSSFQVNTYTTNSQNIPFVATNGSNYIIAWNSYEQDGSGTGVYASIIKKWGYGTDPLNPDTDGDSLDDKSEIFVHRTNPSSADTDNDGLIDNTEIFTYNTNPLDPDSDNDGLTDGEEILHYFSNPLNIDTDNDGMPDEWEVDNNLNILVHDSELDNDNDNLNNQQEFEHNTNPFDPDSDNDGLSDGDEVLTYLSNPLNIDTDDDYIPDGWEVANNLNILIYDSELDNDNDNLINLREFEHNTNPFDPDSDNDGLTDGEEIISIGKELAVKTGILSGPHGQTSATNGENYLITWYRYDRNGSDFDVYGQFLDYQGNKLGSEFNINTYTTDYQRVPSIASNGTTYFVTWYSYEEAGSHKGIYAQLLDNEGNKLGYEFPVNTNTYSSLYAPGIASDGINYFVTWSIGDGHGEGLYGQLFDNEANKLGAEFPINTYAIGDQENSSIASNGTTYFVTWSSDEQDGSDQGVYGQLFDNEGDKLGFEFQVNTYTTGDQNDSFVETNGESYLVTWSSNEQDGSDQGVYGQLFDNEGSKIGSEFRVNSYTTYNQYQQSITSDGTNYLIAWSSYGQDGDNSGIYGQFFDNEGNKLDSEFKINTYTTSFQDRPSITSDNTNYFVTWSSSSQAGYASGIYGSIVKLGYATDPLNPDSDGDGLLDGEEILNYNTDPLDIDSDNDGLIDSDEVLFYYSDPMNPDTDSDSMPDAWEAAHGLNLNLNDADNDADNDSLSNIKELQLNTSPSNSDTDNDGLLDGEEIFQVGEEIQINTYTTNRQSSPSIASNGENFFITWTSNEQDGDSSGIYAQLFDNEGNKITSEFRINAYTESYQSTSSIASNGENFFITWTSNEQDGDCRGVYGKLYDINGNAITSEFQINTYTTGNQWNSAIASDGHNYFIAWISDQQDGNTYGIYGQLFDSTGNAITSEFQINTNNIAPQRKPAIASNGHNYFVVYQGPIAESEIFGQLFDNEGNKIRQEFQINTYSEYIQIFPIITTNNRNHYLIFWENFAAPTDVPRTSVQLFDSEGYRIGAEFYFYYYSSGYSIESNSNNYFMVWDADGSINAKLFDNKGNKIGEEFQVDTNIPNDQYVSCVASDGTKFFVVLVNNGQDGNSEGVFGKLITGYGTNPLISDTDNDGLQDGTELNELDIDPLSPDTDYDGMNDGDEVYVGMEPDNSDSLFALQNITLHDDLNCTTINWFGSVASPDIEYKILWSDYPWSQWNEVELDNGDIGNDDGIRSWTDEGDNDAVSPRPQPTDSINRFYKVIVE